MPAMETVDSYSWPPEGPFYQLRRSYYGGLVVTRTEIGKPGVAIVAHVSSREQWKRFVSVITVGRDESKAISAITQGEA